ncbi:MAG: hypothetical protein DI537_10605 [Stutzerimonas stutzeri]|nr:MAG: hypothetical protein DI537_10605 [Stutzerimonas stutzeri]
MNHREIIEAYGFKIMPRADFLSATSNLIADCCVDQDGKLFEALKVRAGKTDGAFVLFDPEDDDDGWLLIGDDADALALNTVRELDLRSTPR